MKDSNRVSDQWIESAGKLAVVVALGFVTGVFCFLLWAILEHGAN